MRTVIICDNLAMHDEITYYLRKYNSEILGKFTSSFDGYDFIIKEQPDVVFIHIEMPVLNGIDLGVKIREHLPKIMIIFVAQHTHFALESFKAYPTDYLLLPIDETRLAHTINHIRENLSTEKHEIIIKPRIICFGQFTVLNNSLNIRFATQKAAELLSYLLCHYKRTIHRDDMIRALFSSGDVKKDANNLRVTLYRLRHTFKEAGIKKEDVLINENFSIKIDKGVCDLVDFLDFIKENQIINKRNIGTAQSIIDTFAGELFSDIDTSWVSDFREFVMVQVEELLLSTARYYIYTEDELDKAERILIKLIDINDLSENGYMMLLDLYILSADKGKYIHMYRRYAKNLKIDLDSVPDRKYTRYYIKLNK